jgi:hypothetical protein
MVERALLVPDPGKEHDLTAIRTNEKRRFLIGSRHGFRLSSAADA